MGDMKKRENHYRNNSHGVKRVKWKGEVNIRVYKAHGWEQCQELSQEKKYGITDIKKKRGKEKKDLPIPEKEGALKTGSPTGCI